MLPILITESSCRVATACMSVCMHYQHRCLSHYIFRQCGGAILQFLQDCPENKACGSTEKCCSSGRASSQLRVNVCPSPPSPLSHSHSQSHTQLPIKIRKINSMDAETMLMPSCRREREVGLGEGCGCWHRLLPPSTAGRGYLTGHHPMTTMFFCLFFPSYGSRP